MRHCRCDPTRGQTCRRCEDGIDALADERDGFDPEEYVIQRAERYYDGFVYGGRW